MNRFALLSLYRSLTRHPLYAALNIGGLAVGIAVCLVLLRFSVDSLEAWLPSRTILPGAQRLHSLGAPWWRRSEAWIVLALAAALTACYLLAGVLAETHDRDLVSIVP